MFGQIQKCFRELSITSPSSDEGKKEKKTELPPLIENKRTFKIYRKQRDWKNSNFRRQIAPIRECDQKKESASDENLKTQNEAEKSPSKQGLPGTSFYNLTRKRIKQKKDAIVRVKSETSSGTGDPIFIYSLREEDKDCNLPTRNRNRRNRSRGHVSGAKSSSSSWWYQDTGSSSSLADHQRRRDRSQTTSGSTSVMSPDGRRSLTPGCFTESQSRTSSRLRATTSSAASDFCKCPRSKPNSYGYCLECGLLMKESVCRHGHDHAASDHASRHRHDVKRRTGDACGDVAKPRRENVHRRAYILALADTSLDRAFEDPEFFKKSTTKPFFSYYPPLMSSDSTLSDQHPVLTKVSADQAKPLEIKNEMRHIFGNTKLADYYPGGKKYSDRPI